MAISFSALSKLANSAIEYHIRENPEPQDVEDKPLMNVLKQNQKTFPGGKDYVTCRVQGNWEADDSDFFGWFDQTDEVTFSRPDNIDQAKAQWRQAHGGLVLSFTDLLQHGVSIVEKADGKPSSAEVALVKDYIKTALEDEFKESWARCINTAMWSDGTQDAKAVVGLMGLITEDPTTGTVHNIDRAANDWWRNRALLGIGYSPANTTLIQTLNDEIVQLRRYGGRPDYAFCGSDFLGALRRELVAKGEFSQNGFAGTNNIGIGGFVLDGVRFVYDPYLDGVSKAKYSYIIDSRKLKWMPMAGQDGVVHNPERPYNQFVVLKSVTCAVTMLSKHMNCNGVYSIA